MSRCASINPLGFHNFSNSEDSIVCKHDDSKADKEGDKLSEKNVFANPFNFMVCFWTGVGILCALSAEKNGWL